MVAFGIILVAAVLILTRVHAIMSYPDQAIAEETGTSGEETAADTGEEQAADSGTEAETGGDEGSATEESDSQDTGIAQDTTIYIQSGQSSYSIAQDLMDAGLITSADAFVGTIQAMGVENQLQAGTFTIPAGSSMAEIIDILVA